MAKPQLCIRRSRAALLVVDLQQRLLPAMQDSKTVSKNASRLLKSAALLQIPILATEQYPKGLGPTVPEVADAIPQFAPYEKLTFSACGAPRLLSALRDTRASDIVLCGIETHVCVTQTCLDLLEKDFRVFIVADACCSRRPEDHQLGLQRMTQAGAVIASREMVLFELVQRAGTEEFKQLLPWLKDL